MPVLEPGLGEVDRLERTARLAARLSTASGSTVDGGGREVLAVLAAQLVGTSADGGLLIFADQYEEIVATAPDRAPELLSLLNALVGAAGHPERGTPRVRVVVTLGSASLDELLTAGTADALNHGTMLLAPMGRDQLRTAVIGPVPAGAFEPGLFGRAPRLGGPWAVVSNG